MEKPRSPTKGKTEKAGAGEKKSSRKSVSTAAGCAALGTPGTPETNTDSIVVSAEPVTIPSDWSSQGAIALVSHGTLGEITVIHTEVRPGTQIQPIVTTDTAGTSIISLDGSAIPVPFSIPVSMAHSLPVSSDSSSLSVPSVLSVPLQDLPEIPASTPSVLEASEAEILQPHVQTVTVSEEPSENEQTANVQSD